MFVACCESIEPRSLKIQIELNAASPDPRFVAQASRIDDPLHDWLDLQHVGNVNRIVEFNRGLVAFPRTQC